MFRTMSNRAGQFPDQMEMNIAAKLGVVLLRSFFLVFKKYSASYRTFFAWYFAFASESLDFMALHKSVCNI